MLATACADEMYIAVRVISDRELDQYNLAEFLELLTMFFKIAVSLMLILFDVLQSANDFAKIIIAAGKTLGLIWQLVIILLKAVGYGIGIPI
jgi:hypothetical protein